MGKNTKVYRYTPAIFTKGSDFHGFLFASLGKKTLPNWDLPFKERAHPKGANSFLYNLPVSLLLRRTAKKENDGVACLESVLHSPLAINIQKVLKLTCANWSDLSLFTFVILRTPRLQLGKIAVRVFGVSEFLLFVHLCYVVFTQSCCMIYFHVTQNI